MYFNIMTKLKILVLGKKTTNKLHNANLCNKIFLRSKKRKKTYIISVLIKQIFTEKKRLFGFFFSFWYNLNEN